MDQYQIRKVLPEDVPVLAEVAARAFEDDPLTDWLRENDKDPLAMERQMFMSEYRMSKRFDLIFTDSMRQGVAVWKPPGVKATFSDRIIQAWMMIGTMKLSLRTLAKIRFLLDIEKVHYKSPHYYLSLLAVAPEMQGKGLGTALMQPVLEICDRDGIPAYLETETESNVRYYSGKGFRVLQEIVTSDGLSRVWTMLREPKS